MEAEENKAVNVGDLVITAVIAVGCIYMLIASRDFKLLGRLFPQVISGSTLVACLAQTVISLKKKTPKKTGESKSVNFLVIIAIAIVYLVALPFAGFILSTVALMVMVPLYLGYRNQTVIWLLAILFSGGFYFVFKTFFFVPLPQGLLTFI